MTGLLLYDERRTCRNLKLYFSYITRLFLFSVYSDAEGAVLSFQSLLFLTDVAYRKIYLKITYKKCEKKEMKLQNECEKRCTESDVVRILSKVLTFTWPGRLHTQSISSTKKDDRNEITKPKDRKMYLKSTFTA